MVNIGNRKPEYAPNLTIRVTTQTKSKLEAVAQENNRSLRHEIEQRIHESFEAEDLASILLNDKSLMAPLALFAREYSRVLETAKLDRGSKLAIGLAGEVFRVCALSFIEGSLQSNFCKEPDHEIQSENDRHIADEVLSVIDVLKDRLEMVNKDNSLENEILTAFQVSISNKQFTSADILSRTYEIIELIKEELEMNEAGKRIESLKSKLKDLLSATDKN